MAVTLDFTTLPASALIPGQLQKHTDYMPTFSCVFYDADKTTNDRVQLNKVVEGGEAALRFRFKSEVGGLFGKVMNPWLSKFPFMKEEEGFSDYYVFLTASGRLYARNVTGGGQYHIGQDEEHARAITIIASAMRCYADDKQLPAFRTIADTIYNSAKEITSIGAVLPPSDQVKAQENHSWSFRLAQASEGYSQAIMDGF